MILKLLTHHRIYHIYNLYWDSKISRPDAKERLLFLVGTHTAQDIEDTLDFIEAEVKYEISYSNYVAAQLSGNKGYMKSVNLSMDDKTLERCQRQFANRKR